MDDILAYARSKQDDIITFLRQLVECESPSDNPAAVNRFVDLVASRSAGLANVRTFPGGRFGKHVQLEFLLPGDKKSGQILALGHSDTVWPIGTIKAMPFRQEKGRVWGPGVLDMKSGIAFFFFAMQAIRDLRLETKRRVVLQLNSDEEVGSDSSRALTEKEAKKSKAVLVLEPGTGLEGKLKTARKGVGSYEVIVHGKAAHAGVDFDAGASAIVELAWQISTIAEFTDAKKGITVNPGVISGGTRSNVIAAEARTDVDIRIAKLKDEAGLEKKFKSLKPMDKRCRITVKGGLNRPPMERTEAVAALFLKAKKLAAEMGVKIDESMTGGGSDGNFTAALGVATLDGLGGVGEGAHANHESILIDRIADRTALLAKLVLAI